MRCGAPESTVAALGVAASLLAVGCPMARPTLTVRVQSGLRAGYEIGHVDARLVRGSTSCAGEPASIGSRGLALAHADQRALGEGTLTVAEFHGVEPGIYTVRARFRRPPENPGLSADSGPVLVERCLVTTLTSSRVVRIALTTDCVTLSCPRPGGDATHTQCLNGRCTDPRCDPDDVGTAELCCDDTMTGPDCDPAVTLCDADSDCLPVPSCALGRGCLDGVCVEPDGDRCAPGEYCSAVADECVPIDASAAMDAGSPDAPSPLPDAGPARDAADPADAFVAEDAPTDAFVLCGSDGQPCCAGTGCDTGALCVSGTCRACGGVGSPCCVGGVCGAGVCVGGSCAACGAVGQPCCGGGTCTSGVCAGGSCVACGTTGQPCCAGASCTVGICSARACVPCGAVGEVCCGPFCTSGATCRTGSCVPCGGEGQACCGGDACAFGLWCFWGACICHGLGAGCAGGERCCGPNSCDFTSRGQICCGNYGAPCPNDSSLCCGSLICCHDGSDYTCRNPGDFPGC